MNFLFPVYVFTYRFPCVSFCLRCLFSGHIVRRCHSIRGTGSSCLLKHFWEGGVCSVMWSSGVPASRYPLIFILKLLRLSEVPYYVYLVEFSHSRRLVLLIYSLVVCVAFWEVFQAMHVLALVPPLHLLSLPLLFRNLIYYELRVRWTRDRALFMNFLGKVDWSCTFLHPCSRIKARKTDCMLAIQSGPSSDTLFTPWIFFPSLGVKVKGVTI